MQLRGRQPGVVEVGVGARLRDEGQGQGQGQGRCPAGHVPVTAAAVESRKPESQQLPLPLLGAPQHSASLHSAVVQSVGSAHLRASIGRGECASCGVGEAIPNFGKARDWL